MTAAKTRRVLVLSTLWPNATQPRFGTFVARSIEALNRETHWQPVVINPIGLPPVALGNYAALKQAAEAGHENGLEIHRPVFRLLPKVGGRLNPALIARAVMPLAERLHREQPFDLVDAQFFYPDGPAALRIAQKLGLPLSVKARGADIHYWGARNYGREALTETARNAAGMLAVCGALADDMAALGIPRDRVTVHYTGLDRDRFRPLRHTQLRANLGAEFDIPISAKDELLVSVGALIERKGQELVIKALGDLPEARLLLIGKGPDEACLRALAKSEGVSDRVHFLGSLDHDLLPLALSAADAMVLPSSSEGLANAWIEALACGTPLVITDAGGAREVVTSSKAGVIVARHTDALRKGIRLVLDQHHKPEDVAACVGRFSWQANGEALGAYYDRLMAG